MSDNWLRFIPDDPVWRPSKDAADRAATLLKKILPNASDVTFEFKQGVQFVDAGGNWSGVQCPACRTDLADWWSDKLDRAWDKTARCFVELKVTTPCCGTETSLNDLHYVWPVAFGRFVLEAQNPGTATVELADVERLSICLGSKLRVVWCHY